ncbi:hypothetical protein ACJVC5_01600 [Peredibacter sp. HCB2-198]|uniref:hypothetical protein n=1 Tax=Peredibacter sp. HCB2-198 TaxID=3383025 RepID=UPI0038B488A0
MDEIELLVNETFKHFDSNFGEGREMMEPMSIEDMEGYSQEEIPQEENNEFPEGPGLIYHVQKATSVFVVRTFVSQNIREDYIQILERPENYPSLRLLEGGIEDLAHRLKFFMVEESSQAEIIHDQIHNRRFPMREEMMCNISDPGFSWWLTKKQKGFQISFTMSVASEDIIKLGPLGDRELAIRNFQSLESLVTSAGIEMNIQNETNRVQFNDCEEFILEELKDVFEFGVITDTMTDLFRILSKQTNDVSSLQTTWFYLQELAAMRRFWIQIQFDLNS